MKLAEDIWLGSVAARDSLVAAANYSVAFYGNAAVQSWTLGLSAPMVFWSAMARAVENHDAANETASDPKGVATNPAPVLRAVETAPAEAPVPAEDIAAPVAVALVEPVAAPPAADPAPTEAPVVGPHLLDAPRGGTADDLKLVKGIGAKMEASLNEFGIYHFDQIAGLDEAGIAWIDENLPGFKRNCARFDVVGSAKGLL
ncbi:hypothetical protein [Nioella nitratireducens]|uniref:hypothetical protein n=1 Tax=Nioella nitratireducens TaxID=1287720 RepID=UPI0008FD8A59|nr:hypothetical protein [Nioella nitratireducens]